MKFFSYIIYASILCNILTVTIVIYHSFLLLLDENFLYNFKYNAIYKKSIEFNTPNVFLLFSIKRYLTPTLNNKAFCSFYDNSQRKKRRFYKSSFTAYLYSLFCKKKKAHVILKKFFACIYNYYNIIANGIQLLTCLKKDTKKKIDAAYTSYFALANGIKKHSSHIREKAKQFNENLDKEENRGDVTNKREVSKWGANEKEQYSKPKSKGHNDERNILFSFENKDILNGKNKTRSDVCGSGNLQQNSYSACSTPILKDDKRNYYNFERSSLLNTKYYLTKKIKNIFRKTSIKSPNEVDVIYMPDTIVKKRELVNNLKCKNCIVNAEKYLYSLKIRSEHIDDDASKLLSEAKSTDVQVYYDYEHMLHAGNEIYKGKEENGGKEAGKGKVEKEAVKFLTSSDKRKEKTMYLQIDRYYPKKINYSIKEKMGEGAYGEIWYAININKDFPFKDVVLKKILINKDEQTSELNAMREVYFGEKLKNYDNISRFIEYFKEYEIDENKEQHMYVWLAFANEGYSLSKHLFDTDTNNSGMLTPSKLWWSIKKQNIGMLVLKDLLRQILNGINIAHKKDITHRDIKMENIFVSSSTPFTVRIGDWGSAIEFSNDKFFYTPSENEETEGYQPPESLFGHMKNNFMRLPYYDMWGIGIVFLQFVLGTKNPLEVKNKRIEMKLKNLYSKYSTNILKEAIFLQSLSELCLTPWSNSSDHLILLHNKPSYSSIYNNNSIINKLKYYINNNLIKIKKHTSNIIYNIISNKYNSLISIPTSPLCSDWKCVHKYKAQFPSNEKYFPVDVVYGNVTKPLNKHGKDFFYNNNNNSNACNDEQFEKILMERDPSGVGLPNKNARNLLKSLLNFDYSTRITAEQALNHAWFTEN
ncbi:serine/threonine protein kinase, putative [Plasmodium malariae]|uniref:Serine/threonine protein kinase, putative n=1 Tax=Plasmodium malariae TaxID=5858 RepID=A0A1C3L0I9_PLAMA|nr:serine/threonine protein kinase, putative [Plasmodium malariae]